QQRRRYTLSQMAHDTLPEPAQLHPMYHPGEAWRVDMSGVGGMGIGVVTSVLVRAGHKQGYRTIFQDKKGLAIRNGGVFAQITFVKDGQDSTAGVPPAQSRRDGGGTYPTTGSIPYGRADLLLGIDVLEATRAVDPRADFRV